MNRKNNLHVPLRVSQRWSLGKSKAASSARYSVFGHDPIDIPMKTEISSRRDVIKLTVGRMAIAVGATIVLTVTMIASVFGVDPNTCVPLGTVAASGVTIGVIISGLLSGIQTYRSALLMFDLSSAKADLLKMSRTDQLTGLLNRRGYLEAAAEVLAKADEAKSTAVTLMCDIDRFKAINDQFGHEFGDKVLIEISDTIRAFGDEHGALVARHGGEEFVALMVNVSTEQAIQRANALRQICAATKVSTELGTSASVTISIGLAASAEKSSLPAMMQAADQALYRAKRGGRDRVVEAAVA
jgi:diguanylate cyclase (GGDEF)-like protein